MKFTKEYRKKWAAQHYLKNKEKISKEHQEWYKKNKEKSNERTRKYYLKNKEKVSQRCKEHYYKNWTEIQKRHKLYKLNNKEKLRKHYYSESNQIRLKQYRLKTKERDKKVRKEHSKRNRKKINKYMRDRKRNNPNARIRHQLATRLWVALKRNKPNGSKCASTMELVGCTIEELWVHLESSPSWESWMTRENYGRGGWDVDHIVACAKFNFIYPEQQRECFNWRNLQPMEHYKNMSKGAK